MAENSNQSSTASSKDNGSAVHKAHINVLRRKIGAILSMCHHLFPLTWSGILTLLAGIVGWYTLGINRRDLVISSASFILGLLVIALLICVLINSICLYLALRRDDLKNESLKLETGYPRETDFKIHISCFPFTEIRWSWTYPNDVDVETNSSFSLIEETVTANHRCQADRITRHFVVCDIMGLARMEWERTFETPVSIVPRLERFNTNQVLPSISDGDEDSNPYGAPKGDRIEMRKYTQGDSSRDIIWKVYARSRKLMVRIPERAITTQPRSCAYLIASSGDEISANLARTILERHMLGDNWGFGTDGTPGVMTTLGPAIQAIARSGNYSLISPAQAKTTGFAKFLEEAAAMGYNNCLVFIPSRLAPPPPPILSKWKRIFTPLEPDWPDWAKTAHKATSGCHMTITWLMGVDKIPQQLPQIKKDDEQPIWKQRLVKYTLAPKDEVSDTSTDVINILASEQAPVWLYDSQSCRFLVYNRPSTTATR